MTHLALKTSVPKLPYYISSHLHYVYILYYVLPFYDIFGVSREQKGYYLICALNMQAP